MHTDNISDPTWYMPDSYTGYSNIHRHRWVKIIDERYSLNANHLHDLADTNGVVAPANHLTTLLTSALISCAHRDRGREWEIVLDPEDTYDKSVLYIILRQRDGLEKVITASFHRRVYDPNGKVRSNKYRRDLFMELYAVKMLLHPCGIKTPLQSGVRHTILTEEGLGHIVLFLAPNKFTPNVRAVLRYIPDNSNRSWSERLWCNYHRLLHPCSSNALAVKYCCEDELAYYV